VSDAAAARISLAPGGESSIATGVAVLDHLLAVLAETGGFALRLEIAPAEPEAEVGAAGRALGSALAALLDDPRARRRGFAAVPADEALAMVVLEASERPLVLSNADLTSTRAGGLRTDLAAAFLTGLADAAGLTIHVRLIEGEDSQHVLEAIFKALGAALAEACSPHGERS
jgi:imidazoleglycerol-phosphate dehydratase